MLVAVLFLGLLPVGLSGDVGQSAIPFVASLDRSDVHQERLDDVLEHGLILGNGDMNALLYSEGTRLVISLTKNDVWDARLLTENDPPLPTMKRLKGLVEKGWPRKGRKEGNWILPDGRDFKGEDSYHKYPFPCPLQCAQLLLECGLSAEIDAGSATQWKAIRSEGELNAFLQEDASGIMHIQGKAGASTGYRATLTLPTNAKPSTIALRVQGTSNARFFVEAMDKWGHSRFNSGWLDSPQAPKDFFFKLNTEHAISSLTLYTWTKDGLLAENRFEALALLEKEVRFPLSLGMGEAIAMPAHLSLQEAKATVESVPGKRHGAVIRALADRNVFLIESEARPRLRAVTPDFLAPAHHLNKEGIQSLVQEVPGDCDWPGMRYAVALLHQEGHSLLAIVTSEEDPDPDAAARALLRRTLAEGTKACITQHEAVWRNYWAASGIVMEDSVLESAWYRNLYFLRCITKPGVVCPGLFAGLINATPAWHGDYHLNYNLQQTFWSAYVSNHCDLAEPYDRLIRDYLPRAQWLAREVFESEGAYFPHVLYAYEPPDPAACKSVNGRQYMHHVWAMTLGVSGFAVQPLWWRYKYAPDLDLLRTSTYPPIREVALFYARFLAHCERTAAGKAHFGPTVSPEHWGWTEKMRYNYDCAFDIAMARYTLSAAIEAAQVLKEDAALIPQWQAALGFLPDYPQTQSKPAVVVDVANADPITYNISVPATPVYPGDVVGFWSDKAEQDLFKRTIEGLQWNGNNATFMMAIARARLSMEGSDQWLRTEIMARQRPNGSLTLNRLGERFNAFGHYTEQFGAAQAVSELLLQSVGDVLRVLPAWPLEKDVCFAQLRSQGGFLVSGGCKEGRVLPITIQASCGGLLRIVSPWKEIQVQRGAEVEKASCDEQGIWETTTQAGERLVLREAEEAL